MDLSNLLIFGRDASAVESVVSILPSTKVQDNNVLSFVTVLMLYHACNFAQNTGNLENGSFRIRQNLQNLKTADLVLLRLLI